MIPFTIGCPKSMYKGKENVLGTKSDTNKKQFGDYSMNLREQSVCLHNVKENVLGTKLDTHLKSARTL